RSIGDGPCRVDAHGSAAQPHRRGGGQPTSPAAMRGEALEDEPAARAARLRVVHRRMTGVVEIVGRRSGLPPESIDGRLVLSTRSDWIVSGPADARRAIREALSGFAETIGEQLLLSFGNAVGQLDVPRLGVIELRNGKLDEEAFDGMLRDITRFANALPFGAGAGPGLSHQRVAGRDADVLYHAFVYLRHITSPRVARGRGLTDAFAAVLR